MSPALRRRCPPCKALRSLNPNLRVSGVEPMPASGGGDLPSKGAGSEVAEDSSSLIESTRPAFGRVGKALHQPLPQWNLRQGMPVVQAKLLHLPVKLPQAMAKVAWRAIKSLGATSLVDEAPNGPVILYQTDPDSNLRELLRLEVCQGGEPWLAPLRACFSCLLRRCLQGIADQFRTSLDEGCDGGGSRHSCGCRHLRNQQQRCRCRCRHHQLSRVFPIGRDRKTDRTYDPRQRVDQ